MKDKNPKDLSVWQYWQRGLANRKAHADVFVHGDYKTVDDAEKGNVFAYLRRGKTSGTWLIVLNFSSNYSQWTVPVNIVVQDWMAGNYLKGKPDKPIQGSVELRPWEGLLGKCAD